MRKLNTTAFLVLVVLTGIDGVGANEDHKDQTLNAKIDTFLKRDIQNLDSRYSPLRVIQEFELGAAPMTVAQALEQILTGSGYSLCAGNAHQDVNATIMTSAVPDVHRTLIDLSLLEALKILIGPHHDVLIDPVTREVGFALNAYGDSLRAYQQ